MISQSVHILRMTFHCKQYIKQFWYIQTCKKDNVKWLKIVFLRWTRRDILIDINSFTEKHQNREESCTGSFTPKNSVQDSSLFWCFFVNEFMSMKMSRLVHRIFLTILFLWACLILMKTQFLPLILIICEN